MTTKGVTERGKRAANREEAREAAIAKAREAAIAKAKEEALAKAREEALAKAKEEALAKAREEASAKAREAAKAEASKAAANPAKARRAANLGPADSNEILAAEANLQARDIGQSLFDRMTQQAKLARNQKREAELKAQESALLSQKSIFITLNSEKQISMKITSTGSDFTFNTDKAIVDGDLSEFCDVIRKYQDSCTDKKVEGLEFELYGNDMEMLRTIARSLESGKPSIKLDRIVINGPDGKTTKTLTTRKEIDEFLQISEPKSKVGMRIT
tara:strand:+ start:179886 stop:180704 length:819 start_codon:yes stop_codon:yes gene_type:complete